MGLVEGDPLFHPVSKSLKASNGVMLEIISVINCNLLVKSGFLPTCIIICMNSGILTRSVYSTILGIYLQESVANPSDIELPMAGFLINKNS